MLSLLKCPRTASYAVKQINSSIELVKHTWQKCDVVFEFWPIMGLVTRMYSEGK